jgi:7-carboxy-7-deazaguanine synthase
VFVRFAGCNLRCAGWPCDTPHAIFPELYRKEWRILTAQEVLDEIAEVSSPYSRANVCFTGGEPFLQRHDDLKELTEGLSVQFHLVECFSNGTILYPDWAFESIHFVMDWKLPGSGEYGDESQIEKRGHNFTSFKNTSVVKFTIKDEADYVIALNMWHYFIKDSGIDVYAGVVWGTLDNEQLVDWILRDGLPWKLNVQVHNHIWDRSQRGI